jgi:hypothetical protein
MEPQQLLDNGWIASRCRPDRKHAWIVAAPKSGSTWLTEALTRLLGWPTNNLVSFHGRNEQEIDFRQMLRHPDDHLLSRHQHCRYSEITGEFLRLFHTRVLLQGRNIFDSVVSFRDHLDRETLVVPAAWVPDSYHRLTPEERTDFVVRVIAPYYFTFYGSWFNARQRGWCDFCWLTYEDLLADMPGHVRRILAYLGENRSDAEIEDALTWVKGVNTRRHIGITGRGLTELTGSQRDVIRGLTRYYPDVDFSPIGL